MKTNNITIFLLVATIVQLTSHAYTYNTPPPMKWNRTYGGIQPDMAYSVQQTNDNGFAIVGHTSSFGAGSADFWLVKTDTDGNTQWNKTYGGLGRDEAYSIQQTSDGGYILGGSTRSFGAGSSDFWLVKINSSGELMWNKTYGGLFFDIAYSVQRTSDGGYVVAGSTDSLGSGSEDFWVVKTDPNGGMQWNKTYGGLYDEVAYSVQQTSEEGYIVCGYTSSFGAGYEDFWLLKIDPNGNILLNKTYGGENSECAYLVQQTNDNGYVIAGSTYSLGTELDVWLVKTDSSGNMQWNKTYGGTLDEEANAVRQTSDGGYIIAGFTDSFTDNRDIWLIKTDSSGNIEWSQTYGGAEKDEAYCVRQTNDDGYIIAGTTYSFGASWDPDFWLIRLAGLHDITVQDVIPHKTVVGEGYSIFINVTVKNWGIAETFNVTAYANETNIGTQLVTLASGNSITIIFTWDTTGFIKGTYVVSAYAWPVPGETVADDNNYIDGVVFVTIPGDINSDGIVDIFDAIMLSSVFGSTPDAPNWDPRADIDNSGEIDIFDAITLAGWYGRHNHLESTSG